MRPAKIFKKTSINPHSHHFFFSFRLSDFFRILKFIQNALIENIIHLKTIPQTSENKVNKKFPFFLAKDWEFFSPLS